MSFVRYAGTRRNWDSGVETGLFEIVIAIAREATTNAADEQAIRHELDWFNEHVPVPGRFNRTRSKGYYRRRAKGISWFKESASECLRRMEMLRRIAESHGHRISVIREKRIGYIIYEDELQAVAEPFAETRTGE